MPKVIDDKVFILNNDPQTSTSALSAQNKTITDTEESNDNSNNIITIIAIGVVAIVGCILLSGLAYLYYRNSCLPPSQSNSDIEATTSSPVWPDVSVSIGDDEEYKNDRGSDHSLFMGQTAGELE